jgi:aminoglycoside phosphotransferase (APT) family kinase protein
VAALHAAPGRALARHLPATSVFVGSRCVRTAWVDGRPPARVDAVAIGEALRALHATPPPAGLPVLDAASAHTGAVRAARSVALTRPDLRSRLAGLVGVLRRASWPASRVLVHGDLSPDQIVIANGTAVLLDLDRAAVGPPGWDAAQWAVAQLASGGPALPPVGPAEPVLVLAAALQRAPEPFRRLRPDWVQRTEAVLATAEEAAEELP